MRFKLADGVSSISIEQQQFMADRDGEVEVPDHFAPLMKRDGHTQVAARFGATKAPPDPPKASAAVTGATTISALPKEAPADPAQD
jgi:hypothetical protein